MMAGSEFRHADGTPYGALPAATAAEAQTQAFRALRGLGFGEREARTTLDRVLREPESTADVEAVLRQSLKILTERSCAKAH
jgi:Holliday junction resolvasome RuvABC DNA-binding subunit